MSMTYLQAFFRKALSASFPPFSILCPRSASRVRSQRCVGCLARALGTRKPHHSDLCLERFRELEKKPGDYANNCEKLTHHPLGFAHEVKRLHIAFVPSRGQKFFQFSRGLVCSLHFDETQRPEICIVKPKVVILNTRMQKSDTQTGPYKSPVES